MGTCVITEEGYKRDKYLLPFLQERYTVDKDEFIINLKSGEYTGVPREYGIYGGINFTIDGRRYFYNTHKMVWVLIKGLVPVGYLINHKDGVKSNTHIDNLELSTVSENLKHAYMMGLVQKRKNK